MPECRPLQDYIKAKSKNIWEWGSKFERAKEVDYIIFRVCSDWVVFTLQCLNESRKSYVKYLLEPDFHSFA